MTRDFVAIAAIDRFDSLKRTLGYARAVGLLDMMGAEIELRLPGCRVGRAGRSAVEIGFASRNAAAAETVLSGLAKALTRTMEIDGYSFTRAVWVGAADSQGEPVSDALVGLAARALEPARAPRLACVVGAPGAAAAGGPRSPSRR